MTTANELKKLSEEAQERHDLEKSRLAGMGLKSAQRYELLKPLKAEADAAYKTYFNAQKKVCIAELNKFARNPSAY